VYCKLGTGNTVSHLISTDSLLNYACLLDTKRPVSAGLAISKTVRRRGHIYRHSRVEENRHVSTESHPLFSRLRRNDASRGLVKYQSRSNRQYCTLNHLNTFLSVLQDNHVPKYIAERRHSPCQIRVAPEVKCRALGVGRIF